MSHAQRIRNTIRPFKQVSFEHAEGSRVKRFVNTLTGDASTFTVPFTEIGDEQAKYHAEALTVSETRLTALEAKLSVQLTDAKARIAALMDVGTTGESFDKAVADYKEASTYLPRLRNYLSRTARSA